ncbi:MAG: DUF5684 domain-containing protein [Verrucomicrobiota bacterium]|nr:hypothetical protein [Verrucomicrobiota bacterium]MCC6821134.1 hypothetical protein [Limisphaerales bacterium]
MNTRTRHSWRAGAWRLAGVCAAWLAVAHLPAAEIELATLKSGTDVFTNVTVYAQTETDLFIKHARGFGNIKISTLDSATLRLLKPGGESSEAETAGANPGKMAAALASVKGKLAEAHLEAPSEAEVLDLISRVRPSPNLLLGILAGALFLYLLFCACMKLICQNAGSKAGLLIWIPVLQMFPLLRAAKMSAWWFVAFLIPFVGVVAHIVWCVKISKACGKGALVTVMLILPGTNVLALLYLALAKGGSQPVEPAAPPRHTMVLGEA